MDAPPVVDPPRTGTGRRAVVWPRVARAAAAGVLVVVVVVLVGWALDAPSLTRILPGWPVTTPWTAVGLAALAVSVGAQTWPASSTAVSRAVGAAAGALGLVVLGEYASGSAGLIDTALWPVGVGALQAEFPGRPSPQTAVMLVVVAGSALLQRSTATRAVRAWVVLSLMGWTIASVSVLGYLFGRASPFFLSGGTGMGILTALCFLLLVLAGVAARPERPALSWLLQSPHRTLTTQVAVGVIALPVAFRAVDLALLQSGWPEAAALTIAFAVCAAGVLVAAVFLGTGAAARSTAQELSAAPGTAAAPAPKDVLTRALDEVPPVAVLVTATGTPTTPAAATGADEEGGGFLLRRLVRDHHAPEGDASAAPGPGAAWGSIPTVRVDPDRLVDADDLLGRLAEWQEHRTRPATVVVTVEGLSALDSALGVGTGHFVARAVLARALGASHTAAVAVLLGDDRFVLAQPAASSWVFRLRRGISGTIGVAAGTVGLRVEHDRTGVPSPPTSRAQGDDD